MFHSILITIYKKYTKKTIENKNKTPKSPIFKYYFILVGFSYFSPSNAFVISLPYLYISRLITASSATIGSTPPGLL